MSEHVYAEPDLTQKVRYGRGERGDGIATIYATVNHPEPNPDPGRQQDAAQSNTAQRKHAGSEDSKHNLYIAAAVCVGLLCLLLLVGIIVLLTLYCASFKEKNILQSSFDKLQTTHDNMTKQKDKLQTNFDQLKTSFDNMTEQRDQCEIRFEDLQTRHTKLIERDTIKKILLCESRGFTFGDGVCYYISTERRTWEQSRTYCRRRQADLMIIKCKEKLDFVDRVVGRDYTQWLWLGLSDRETKGPLTTPYPRPGLEPNNAAGGQDCVVFGNGGRRKVSCNEHRRWICEMVV